MKTTLTSDDPEWFTPWSGIEPPRPPLWARLALAMIRALLWVTQTVVHTVAALVIVAFLAYLIYN